MRDETGEELLVPRLSPEEIKAAATTDPAATSLAFQELATLSSGRSPEELEADEREREFSRNQKFKDHFERIAIVALWVFAAAILAVGSIWLWHLLMPPKCRWLTTEDVSHLQSIATAGLLVGLVSNHFKKRLG